MELNLNHITNCYSSGICRACLTKDNTQPMRDELSYMFTEITGLQLLGDNLPKDMCGECALKLRNSSEFRNQCLHSNQWLMQKIKSENSNLLKSKINNSKITKNNKGKIIPVIKSKHKEFTETSDEIIQNDDKKVQNVNSDCLADQIEKDPLVKATVFDENNSLNVDSDIQFFFKKFTPETPKLIEINPNSIKLDFLETYEVTEHDVDDVSFNDFEHEEIIETEIINEEMTNTESIEYNESHNPDVETIKLNEITNTVVDESEIINIDKISLPKYEDLNDTEEEMVHENISRRNNKIGSIEELKENYNIRHLNYQEQIEEHEKRKHLEEYKNAKFKCDLCYHGFENAIAFRTHSILHTEKCGSALCDICKLCFKDNNIMNKHKLDHHIKLISCKICDFTTTSRVSARWHTPKHKLKFICKFCKRRFRLESSLLFHIKVTHASESQSSEKQKIELKNPRPLVTKPSEVGPKRDLCKTTFANDQEWAAPVNISDLESGSQSNSSRNDGKSDKSRKVVPRKCKKSSHISGYKSNLYKITFADDEELAVNVQADVESGTKSIISYSIKVKSRDKKPRKCKKCGEVVSSAIHLRRHYLKHHNTSTEENEHLCFVCGKSFKQDNHLRVHLYKHDIGQTFKCDLCDSTFTRRSSYQYHKSTHLKTKYKCRICSRKFNNTSALYRHERTHSTERKEKCDFCEKSFKTKEKRKIHIDHVHFKKPYKPRIRRKKSEKKDSLGDDSS